MSEGRGPDRRDLEKQFAEALNAVWKHAPDAAEPVNPSHAFYLPDEFQQTPEKPTLVHPRVEMPKEPNIFECLLEVLKEDDPDFDIHVPQLPPRPAGMTMARYLELVSKHAR